ncbi:MAG TPA: hypothetical protein VFD35_03980 [Pricia sp.]|nr:hypothetical protein [Pricia sp.]
MDQAKGILKQITAFAERQTLDHAKGILKRITAFAGMTSLRLRSG